MMIWLPCPIGLCQIPDIYGILEAYGNGDNASVTNLVCIDSF